MIFSKPSTRCSANLSAVSWSANSRPTTRSGRKRARCPAGHGRRPGEQGFLCAAIPEEWGGVGADRRYSIILMEEQARLNLTGLGFALHSDIVAPLYPSLRHHRAEARLVAENGDRRSSSLAIAMTEPGGGSDLQAIRTTAIRDGDEYVAPGPEDLHHQRRDWRISSSSPARPTAAKASRGISPRDGGGRPSRLRARPPRLKKLGTKAQDTSELFFNDVRVPVTNRIGRGGQGLRAT